MSQMTLVIMAIIMMMSIKVFQDHFCTTGIWTRIFYCIFDELDEVGNDDNDDNNDDEDDIHLGSLQDHYCTTGDWTRINGSISFLHFEFTLFYEPVGIGNMTKVMIMINLVLIMMVIMIMLIFLQ